MRVNQAIVKTLVAGVALSSGLVVGVFASGAASAGNHANRADLAPHVFPTNVYGQTYGSGLDAVSPANEPDLIQAYATNGVLGYVRAADLDGTAPTNPISALAQERAAQAAHGRTIPVYAQDGRTVVGSFTIGSPVSGTIVVAPRN
jgi:hypothetical protein